MLVALFLSGCTLAVPSVAPAGHSASADCEAMWAAMDTRATECGGHPSTQARKCGTVLYESEDVGETCLPALKSASCAGLADDWQVYCSDVFRWL